MLTVLVVAFGGLGTAQVATADLSYNIGYVSEYYFRGILQKSSSASAGIDYEENGFYIGAWGADVGDGIEYDIERVSGLKSMFFGGEGLFLATLRGHGSVLLQSLPFSRLADRVIQHAPALGGTDRGEGSVLGGLGNLFGD